jgi:hypothetical protein
MATIGTESIIASARGVTRFVPPGPEVAMHDPDPARGVGVALGHVAGALLVAGEDVTDRRVEHRVVRGEDRAAGMAEHDLDTRELQRLDDRLCACHLHGDTPARHLPCG